MHNNNIISCVCVLCSFSVDFCCYFFRFFRLIAIFYLRLSLCTLCVVGCVVLWCLCFVCKTFATQFSILLLSSEGCCMENIIKLFPSLHSLLRSYFYFGIFHGFLKISSIYIFFFFYSTLFSFIFFFIFYIFTLILFMLCAGIFSPSSPQHFFQFNSLK